MTTMMMNMFRRLLRADEVRLWHRVYSEERSRTQNFHSDTVFGKGQHDTETNRHEALQRSRRQSSEIRRLWLLTKSAIQEQRIRVSL